MTIFRSLQEWIWTTTIIIFMQGSMRQIWQGRGRLLLTGSGVSDARSQSCGLSHPFPENGKAIRLRSGTEGRF